MPDLGWQPDNRASRDRYKLPSQEDGRQKVLSAPPDTRPLAELLVPVIKPREDFHACAASAIAAAIQLELRRVADDRLMPSVRFLYYIGRYLQRREHENNGASILATLRAAQAIGFCSEELWPLDGTHPDGQRFTYNETPSEAAYKQALDYGVLEFRSIEREYVEQCLAARRPVVFGILVEESFLKDPNRTRDIVPAPTTAPVDRHSLLAVGSGADGDRKFLLCRDSLGPDRGTDGYVRLAWDYVLMDDGWCDDFWTITSVATPTHKTHDLKAARDKYEKDAREFSGRVKDAYEEAVKNRRPQTPARLPPIAAKIGPAAVAPDGVLRLT